MEFYEHLKSYLSDIEIAKLKNSLSLENKHAVLLNNRKMDEDKFLSLYPNVTKHPFVKNAYLYDKNEYDLGKSIYHLLGCFYLQEPSAMMPSFLLNPKENETILDMCAAPGGKSVQASFLMDNKGIIISNDLSKNRCTAILENIERLGIGNIVITNNDFSSIYQNYLNYFDRIILDAPCSGSGMFRKDDKMELDWSYNKVIKFQEIQKELIIYAYKMLKPGGTMVYSTCSFSKEEDEDVISYLLEKEDGEIINIEKSPLFYVNKNMPLGIHLFPYLFPGEGHYICLIKKPGILNIEKDKKEDIKEPLLKPYQEEINHLAKYGDYYFSYPKEFKNKRLNIIRPGVKVGEILKGFIKYDYHFARFISNFPSIDINFAELKQYLNGEMIKKISPKGYLLLKYNNINVDIAKSDGINIKNHYPKGLRVKIKEA